MTAPLLDHLAEPLPAGFDDVLRVVHTAANAKRDGSPRKRERASLAKCRAWLLGEDQLTEDERVWLAVARRNVKLNVAFRKVQRAIWKGDKYPVAEWITAEPIKWKATA